MQSYSSLQKNFTTLQSQLQRRQQQRRLTHQKRKQELAQLQQTYQQKNNTIISKIQELKRKETLLITLKRIEPPTIPQNYPKNYYCQLVYEDNILSGTHKFTDFDENVIEEKFVLPLLFSSVVKVEIWTAEEEPTLWGRGQINLEKDIEVALISEICDGQVKIGEEDVSIVYRLQLQGIGFSTWLKNIIEIRQLQIQKAFSREQGHKKREQARLKAQQKKQKFKAKFQRQSNKAQTHEIKVNNVEDILQQLQAD